MLLMKKQRTFTTGFSGFVPDNYDQCFLMALSYALKKMINALRKAVYRLITEMGAAAE